MSDSRGDALPLEPIQSVPHLHSLRSMHFARERTSKAGLLVNQFSTGRRQGKIRLRVGWYRFAAQPIVSKA